MRAALFCLVAGLCAAAAGGAPRYVPAPRPARSDALVGAFYFPGWSTVQRWWCMAANREVQHPLLGYYDQASPEAADWHIKWALEHGISFFAYDYYSHFGTEMLENALDRGLFRARYLPQFRFCLNWCNHAPVAEMTREQLRQFADTAVPKYLKHPSYLRIGGKPVLIILSGNSFVKNLGVDEARAAFQDLDERCRREGLPGVHLVFCEGEVRSADDVKASLAAGAQGFCLYNYPYAGTGVTGPGTGAEAPYAQLNDEGEKLWKHWGALTGGRFWPTVMPGWDRRPWTKDRDLVRTGATPALFAEGLRRARQHMNADRVVMVEAWNEWGEGSILEPSEEQRFGYLDRVRDAFCPGAGKHTDADPRSVGRPRPAFDLRLPRQDAWLFDFDTEGWTRSGMDEPRAAWGALVATSTTGDPQLLGPESYLPCAQFRAVVIRLRASAAASGAPDVTDGQLFWSTVEHEMAAESSVSFKVPLDGAWHEVVLPLAGHPRWKGTLHRLRLDPAALAGVRVEVDTIRLVRGDRPESEGKQP